MTGFSPSQTKKARNGIADAGPEHLKVFILRGKQTPVARMPSGLKRLCSLAYLLHHKPNEFKAFYL
jgi:hypothetical protein